MFERIYQLASTKHRKRRVIYLTSRLPCLASRYHYNKHWKNWHLNQGSVALEYIIVSTFAAILSITAIAFIGKVAKSKFEKMGDKLGVDPGETDFDFMNEP